MTRKHSPNKDKDKWPRQGTAGSEPLAYNTKALCSLSEATVTLQQKLIAHSPRSPDQVLGRAGRAPLKALGEGPSQACCHLVFPHPGCPLAPMAISVLSDVPHPIASLSLSLPLSLPRFLQDPGGHELIVANLC